MTEMLRIKVVTRKNVKLLTNTFRDTFYYKQTECEQCQVS